MEILKINDLTDKDEIDVVEYLKESSTKMLKNRNILTNKILQGNECFNDYLFEVECEQQIELTKFKSIIQDLNRRIERGDF